MAHEWQRDGITVSTDRARLDLDRVYAFLSTSYWAQGLPRAVFERSVAGAECFGVYNGREQVGFARVITDRATFGYLADVFIAESHRGRGLSRFLMECVVAHPELQGFRRWLLATRDAHGLYARFGFTPLGAPDRWMERHDPEVYMRGHGLQAR